MVEGFLNNSPKFNNSLLNLLFQLFSIKIVSFREIRYIKIAKTHCFQRFCNSIIFVTLFHLNRSWWLGCQIIEHPIHALYLIHDSIHHSL